MANEITKVENDAAFIIPNGNFNTVSMDSIKGKIALTNAINNSESLYDYCQKHDEPMHVVDIVVTAGKRRNRDGGDDIPCDDTRLILADGTSLLSQSGGIAKSARFIAGLMGSELKGGGLLIRVVARTMSNGNTIKALDVVGKA